MKKSYFVILLLLSVFSTVSALTIEDIEDKMVSVDDMKSFKIESSKIIDGHEFTKDIVAVLPHRYKVNEYKDGVLMYQSVCYDNKWVTYYNRERSEEKMMHIGLNGVFDFFKELFGGGFCEEELEGILFTEKITPGFFLDEIKRQSFSVEFYDEVISGKDAIRFNLIHGSKEADYVELNTYYDQETLLKVAEDRESVYGSFREHYDVTLNEDVSENYFLPVEGKETCKIKGITAFMLNSKLDKIKSLPEYSIGKLKEKDYINYLELKVKLADATCEDISPRDKCTYSQYIGEEIFPECVEFGSYQECMMELLEKNLIELSFDNLPTENLCSGMGDLECFSFLYNKEYIPEAEGVDFIEASYNLSPSESFKVEWACYKSPDLR